MLASLEVALSGDWLLFKLLPIYATRVTSTQPLSRNTNGDPKYARLLSTLYLHEDAVNQV